VKASCNDAKAVSALAHARGAYLFADIIQAWRRTAGRARARHRLRSGRHYKWLMGERGIGFLYVPEDLQGTVLRRRDMGIGRWELNRAELSWEPLPGAAKYETGGIGVLLAACVSEGSTTCSASGSTRSAPPPVR